MNDSEYGNDLAAVEKEYDSHQKEHKIIHQFHTNVDKCAAEEVKGTLEAVERTARRLGGEGGGSTAPPLSAVLCIDCYFRFVEISVRSLLMVIYCIAKCIFCEFTSCELFSLYFQ